MPLPERDYFKLDDIAQRWKVSTADVEHYAETEKLEVYVRLLSVQAEGGMFLTDETGTVAGGVYTATTFQERLRGFHPIRPLDLWEIFRRGEVNTDHLKPREGDDFLLLERDITITRDDLVVSRSELERFEKAYKVCVDSREADATETQRPQTDKYHTGFPGRPSIRGRIQAKFEERVEANKCLLTLAAEARWLSEWARKEHPGAPPTTAKTVENHIRHPYKQRVRNRPTK